MTDWTRFHAAVLAGTLQGEIPKACELAWSWLDLPPDDRRDRTAEAIRNESQARWMMQALSFVRRRLIREAGVDPDDTPRVTQYFEALGAGRATAGDLEFVRRFDAAVAIDRTTAELFPGAKAPPAPADPQKELLVASVPALTVAIHGPDVGVVTPESLAKLHEAIAAFAAIGQGFAPDAAREHAWWMGVAWWAAGRGALDLGRNDEGRAAFERSTTFYELSGDENAVEECRRLLRDLELRRNADFDSAADRELRALLVRQDPLGRVAALTRLSRDVGSAGDRYEAGRLAELAARVLVDARYRDPEHGSDAAADQWIATAAETCTGNALFARLCQVAEAWAAILGARTSKRLNTDPEGSARAEQALREIATFAPKLFEEAGIAEDQAAARFAAWHSQTLPSEPRPNLDAALQRTAEINALDDDLQKLRNACNERASEALVAQAVDLRARAENLGSRVHLARAVLEQVYVLLALERFAEVPVLADLAVQTLLAGQPARLGSFATGFERELYLMAINYKARALAAKTDHEAILAACEPVIRDIESERARVSSPYQQSAFLATRAELYELAATAAYRTGRLDLWLAITELLKARAALRSRLMPETVADASEIEAELAKVNAALAQGDAGAAQERELRERRRWLASARAIARARAGAAPPEISIAALKAVLAEDEAAVSWFWLGSSVALVLAITREDVRTSVIKLDAKQEEEFRDYLASVAELAGASPQYRTLIPRIDGLVAALGPVLLPQELREPLARKSRLVLSPHRTLHLFPFHAVPWEPGHLIEHFAVRYVPNLSSLLLPWSGNVEGPVLAVGVAKFEDPDVGELPHAKDEATAVASAHGDAGQALVDPTRAQFTALPLHSYRCLHLATHGSSVLAGDALDDPMESCVYFRDGALSGWDIAALPLRAELVVLAACHSGQRSVAGRGLDKLPGDDIFGLQGALFEAGAHSVLGAMWPVADAVALAILTDFHRAYADGAVPEVALRKAVQAHLANPRRRRDLFYWAPLFMSSLGARAGHA